MNTSPWVESRKQFKRNHMLDLIRRSPEPLSRYDLKKLTGYSMTTVSNSVADLVKDGLLLEDSCADTNRVGRRPTPLRLNSDGGYLIGVEFNIEHLHCAILDFSGRPVYSRHADMPLRRTRDEVLTLIYKETQRGLDFLGERARRVLGIGLGLPGYIDRTRGIVTTFPHLPDWDNVPIVRLMEERFSLPCYIRNNVGVMGLVFKWVQEYHEEEDFLLVSIRSGARCIPVLNHQPYFGRISTTGEIGHLKVAHNGRVCDCGQTGCLNTEISDVSIRDILEEGFAQGQYTAVQQLSHGGRPSSALLVQAALTGDQESIRLLRRCAHYLGEGIAAAANLFAPQKIIISGQLAKGGELFFQALEQTVRAQCLPAVFQNLTLSPSPFGEDIGALGAAALILEQQFNPFPGVEAAIQPGCI